MPLPDAEQSNDQVTASIERARPVVLVGFQRQGNLGLGYLASTLRQHGHEVTTCDFELQDEEILSLVRQLDPIVIGFSVIFQLYVQRFASLIDFLRHRGVTCHFTIGGHFPSLSAGEALQLLAGVDSVVRFEGELTLLELVQAISTGADWRSIHGIAYRDGSGIFTTPVRALIQDLDQLPFPERSFEPEGALGFKAFPLLASRGCSRTCAFCSIQTFYRSVPGKLVRVRAPVKVVEEMRSLYEDRTASIFLFQDDDFPLHGSVWRRWALEFVRELERSGLSRRAIWKISCRADDVDPELFSVLHAAGLYLVYLGLESGNQAGLQLLHKQTTVEQNLRAVATLKQLGLMFTYGFMLFDPSSTLATVRTNLEFLRQTVGDGSGAAVFCKMIPYDGTPIKKLLEQSGRLRGDVCHPDYEFQDPMVTTLHSELSILLEGCSWIHGDSPLASQVDWARHEVAVMERLLPPLPGMDSYKATIQRVTKDVNETLFAVVQDISNAVQQQRPTSWTVDSLNEVRSRILDEMLRERNKFILQHQASILDGLHAPRSLVDAAEVPGHDHFSLSSSPS